MRQLLSAEVAVLLSGSSLLSDSLKCIDVANKQIHPQRPRGRSWDGRETGVSGK